MIVLAPRYLPETARSSGRFDLADAVTATAGVGLLVLGIINMTGESWNSPVTQLMQARTASVYAATRHWRRPPIPIEFMISA